MAKRAAIEMTDESLIEPMIKRSKCVTKEKLLIDLHDDYLKLIFKWLEMSDLLTIIQVSERFVDPVASVFAKKYPTERVMITLADIPEDHPDVLVLKATPIIKPFFRYFGHSILKLCFEFHPKNSYLNINRSVEIEKSILKYCEELKELVLVKCRYGAFDALAKPFKSLEVFRFVGGYLGENISRFDKWFPKLRSLQIYHATVVNELCIEDTLPFLQHLDIKIGASSKTFFRENIDKAIHSNPQLRSICLSNDCKPRDLRLVCRELKGLEKLEFWLHPDNFKKACKRPIKFENVKQLILNIYDKNNFVDIFDIDVTSKFLIFGDKLEELEVRCYRLHKQYIDFASEYNLKKLTLNVLYHGPTIKSLMKIASHWPNLIELTVQVDNVNSDGVIRFINACNHLQRINIWDEPERQIKMFQELKSKLSSEWQLVKMITKGPFLYMDHSIIRKSYVF